MFRQAFSFFALVAASACAAESAPQKNFICNKDGRKQCTGDSWCPQTYAWNDQACMCFSMIQCRKFCPPGQVLDPRERCQCIDRAEVVALRDCEPEKPEEAEEPAAAVAKDEETKGNQTSGLNLDAVPEAADKVEEATKTDEKQEAESEIEVEEKTEIIGSSDLSALGSDLSENAQLRGSDLSELILEEKDEEEAVIEATDAEEPEYTELCFMSVEDDCATSFFEIDRLACVCACNRECEEGQRLNEHTCYCENRRPVPRYLSYQERPAVYGAKRYGPPMQERQERQERQEPRRSAFMPDEEDPIASAFTQLEEEGYFSSIMW